MWAHTLEVLDLRMMDLLIPDTIYANLHINVLVLIVCMMEHRCVHGKGLFQFLGNINYDTQCHTYVVAHGSTLTKNVMKLQCIEFSVHHPSLQCCYYMMGGFRGWPSFYTPLVTNLHSQY